MAIYRVRYKYSKNGVSHLEYINREGKYKSRKDLEIINDFNLPKNFENSKDFWQTAEKFERKNGTVYREFEIALPVEFSGKYNQEILEKFLEKTFEDRFFYNYAIHNPGDKQPHAHVMFSNRELDGIDREKSQFFKRYNPNNSELGGAKKDPVFEKKVWLIDFRKDWETHINKYLEANGIEKVSSETLKKQREKAIKNGEILKAELLDREPMHYKKNLKYNKEQDSISNLDNEMKKQTQKQNKEIQNEINRIYFQKKFLKELEKKREEFKYKAFKEILNEKERIEIEIFKLTKKMEDKNLESKGADILSKGEINKLKNERRALYKKIKNDKNNKSEYSKKINDIDEKIDFFCKNNIKKIYEEKLKLKSKYTKVLKFKVNEKEIIDKIFKDYLNKNKNLNLDEKNLYKAYFERKDLREEVKNNENKILKNKEKIKEFIKHNDYKQIFEYKNNNNFLRTNIKSLKKADKICSKSLSLEAKVLKHGEFIISDYKHINFDEEYDLDQFER